MGNGGKDKSDRTAGDAQKGKAEKNDVVVLMSSFIVPPTMEDAFLGWWRMARPFIAAQPGFVSAKLLKTLDAREGLRYANIVEWRSGASYRNALTKLWTSGPPPIPGLDWRPQIFEIVEET